MRNATRIGRVFQWLLVLAWQIDMAVQAGIAASMRPAPPPPLPSKQVELPRAKQVPACTTGKCPLPATAPR